MEKGRGKREEVKGNFVQGCVRDASERQRLFVLIMQKKKDQGFEELKEKKRYFSTCFPLSRPSLRSA